MVRRASLYWLAVMLTVAACDEEPYRIHEPEDGFAVRYYDAWAMPDGDVYAVGERPFDEYGVLLRFDGAAWTKLSDLQFVASKVWAADPDRVWVGGADLRTTAQPLGYWNGEVWDDVVPNGVYLDSVTDIWGTSRDDVWVLATPQETTLRHATLFHWDGATWSESPEFTAQWPPVESPEYIPSQVRGGCSSGVDDVWVVGDWSDLVKFEQSVAMHWNGSVWESLPMCWCCFLESISCNGADAWATVRDCDDGSGTVLHLVDGAWIEVQRSIDLDPAPTFGGIWAADGRAWVAGHVWHDPEDPTGMVLRLDGERVDQLLPDVSDIGELSAVTVDASGRVWGFGDLGAIVEIAP